LNPETENLVVHDYFTLVQAIACKIKRRLPAHVDVEDLVQTGMIGLLEASNRYDAARKVDFSSYANLRITGAILDELRRWDTCTRRDRRTARAIENVKQSLRAITRREPSREEIAGAVGLGLAEYDQTLQRLESGRQPTVPAGDQETDAQDELSRIPSKEETPFEACSKKEDFALLRKFIAELKPRYRKLLHLYYFHELGLKEIGERMGVGEARVSQIHKQAIGELKRIIVLHRPQPARRISNVVQ